MHAVPSGEKDGSGALPEPLLQTIRAFQDGCTCDRDRTRSRVPGAGVHRARWPMLWR